MRESTRHTLNRSRKSEPHRSCRCSEIQPLKVEAGRLELNRELQLENLNVDARSSLSGHFSVELPFEMDPDFLDALAADFRVPLPASASI